MDEHVHCPIVLVITWTWKLKRRTEFIKAPSWPTYRDKSSPRYMKMEKGMYSSITKMSVTASHLSIMLIGAFDISFLVRTITLNILARVPNKQICPERMRSN